MIRVALTGNIGSGKSTVAKIFSVYGVPVFNSDIEARMLYFDPEVKTNLRLLFEDMVFKANGDVDTKALASIIFNDKNALQKVNNLIHPLVFEMYNNWCKNHSAEKYTIHESAILFENNLQNHFDIIINVSAPSKLRVNRVMERDNVSKEKVEERMLNQLDDKIKCELSQFVIVNDGDSFLIPQVDLIHNKLITQVRQKG